MRHPMRLFLRMLAMPAGATDPPETLVAIPAPAVLLLLGTVWVAILMMMAMLALEIVILIQVFEVVDLLDKLVLFG